MDGAAIKCTKTGPSGASMIICCSLTTHHQVSAILNIYGHHDHNGFRGIFCSHTYIYFLILRELRDKKTKEDALLFPGVFFFYPSVRFFGPLPIFILILLFPLRFFLHFSGDEWGYFLRIQPHCVGGCGFAGSLSFPDVQVLHKATPYQKK